MESWTDNFAPQEWHDAEYRDVYEAFVHTDWSNRLGMPLDEWPDTLRIMVYHLFATDTPASIHWGREKVQIYNAALKQHIARDLHPALMGSPWLETWSSRIPFSDRIFAEYIETLETGKGEFHKELTVCLTIGQIENEEKIYNSSTVPIRSPCGKVHGIFVRLEDRTDFVVTQRIEKSLDTFQEAVAHAASSSDLYVAFKQAANDLPRDVPCLAGYFCDQLWTGLNFRTFSRVVGIGVFEQNLPGSLCIQSAESWRALPLPERTIEYYIMEVLVTGKSVRLTDSGIISRFCERRAFGDITKTVIVYPLYCFGQDVPVGIVLQGLNPRRNQADESVVNRFDGKMGAAIEVLRKQSAASEQLHARTAELEASQRKFEVMMRACPAGIFVLNLRTQEYEFANDAYYEMTGIPKELGPSVWPEYIHPDQREAGKQLWSDAVKLPITNFESRWIKDRQGGIERWTSGNSLLHQDASGNRYVFGAFSDTSAMRYALRAEKDRADAAVQTKQQQLAFLDMIAHELRNPLGAIMQQSELLVSKSTSRTELVGSPAGSKLAKEGDIEDLNTIGLCAQHMSRIINDTLNLSKLESGMLIATPVPTQPLAVIKSVLAMFDAEAKRGQILLSLEVEDSFHHMKIDWVRTDPSRFAQVLINLLANAIKFLSRMTIKRVKVCIGASQFPLAPMTQAEPDISISGNSIFEVPSERLDLSASDASSPTYLICKVIDTGPGMTEDQVSSLFKRYFQASPRTHVEYGGSGLGLFISKQLVGLLGGTMKVESVKDCGTTFAFSIRTIDCEAPRRGSVPEIGPSGLCVVPRRQGDPDTILIAEDNPINQKVMQRQLSNAGFATLIADNGREALDLLVKDRLTERKIALCLCDVEMPFLGGVEVIKEVRKLEALGKSGDHCPFIAVTANAREAQIAEMLEAGMDDTLSKPFRFDDLLAKIAGLMSRLGLSPIPTRSSSGTPSDNGTSIPLKRKHTSSTSSLSVSTAPPNKTLVHTRFADLWSGSLTQPLKTSINVIVLNTPPPSTVARKIWQRASVTPNCLRICCDGGTDRLHNEILECAVEEVPPFLQPDVILGDLDSIKSDTKDFYDGIDNTKVIEIHDQNSTDFTKAIKFCMNSMENARSDIVVLGGIDGRLDQTFSTLNTLFKRERIYIIDSSNVVTLLQAGAHRLDCTGLGSHCGLVPIKGPVKCWSTGLKWCLEGEIMEIDRLISTNNHIVSADRCVSVRCDGPVLFSVELHD